MKIRFYSRWFVVAGLCFSAAGAEVSFQSVALINESAPGLSNNARFSGFNDLSLAGDGRVAFTANVSGSGINSSNNLGIWAGLPGELRLLARTGDPMPGCSNCGNIRYLANPAVDEEKAVGFLATDEEDRVGKLLTMLIESIEFLDHPEPPRPFRTHRDFTTAKFRQFLGFVVNTTAGQVELSGPGIGPTNNIAIVAGPPTNAAIVAQTGSPARGVTNSFTSISQIPGNTALMPSGKVAFVASTTAEAGVWLGNGDNVEGVALSGRPAPVSLLGSGYSFGFQRGENLEVNARGELAFSTFLHGPGVNDTNSEFVVAGPPGALRVVMQSGQPAPGIPGAYFQPFFDGGSSFSHVLLGPDGTVVFVGCYSATGKDFGLWLAPGNGATPLLLMRNGQQAPGTPPGVVFNDDTLTYVPPFRQAFMNARNQVVFRARLGGPGIGTSSFGIWLAEPDGMVSLITRSGDVIDTGDGILRELDNVTFGVEPVFMAGPEDGRRSPFNDRGEIALLTYFTETTGVVIARAGLNIYARRAGNDIRINFPTLTNKTYRVDYATNLPVAFWPVLKGSLIGRGNEMTVTDTNALSAGRRFYRAVRFD